MKKKLAVLEPPVEPPKEEPKKLEPCVSFRYSTGRNTTIEVAVWPNEFKSEDDKVLTYYTVTNFRSYCDDRGEWHDHNGYYRLNDLPALFHALKKAYAFIMEQRELNSRTPF